MCDINLVEMSSPFTRATLLEFSCEKGYGRVRLEDGREFVVDANAIANRDRVTTQLVVGALVWASIGRSRLGGDKVESLHCGDAPPALGPSVSERLDVIRRAGLLQGLDTSQLTPSVLEKRLRTTQGHPGEGTAQLLQLLDQHYRHGSNWRHDGFISLTGRKPSKTMISRLAKLADALSTSMEEAILAPRGFDEETMRLRVLHRDGSTREGVASSLAALVGIFAPFQHNHVPYMLWDNEDIRGVWLLTENTQRILASDAHLRLVPFEPLPPSSDETFPVFATKDQADSAWTNAPWNKLSTPKGEAPCTFAGLLAPDDDEDTYGDAESFLYSELYHQGTFSREAADAIPFLVAWLDDAATPRRTQLAHHIAFLACEARLQAEHWDPAPNAVLVLHALRANRQKLARVAREPGLPSNTIAGTVGLLSRNFVPEHLMCELPAHTHKTALQAARNPKRFADRLFR